MTKKKRFKPARFLPGRGVPWHGGMKPLPQPTKRKTPASAANTDRGKVEKVWKTPISTSNDTRETEENQA